MVVVGGQPRVAGAWCVAGPQPFTWRTHGGCAGTPLELVHEATTRPSHEDSGRGHRLPLHARGVSLRIAGSGFDPRCV